MERRRFLAAVGTTGATAWAGCLGDSDGGGSEEGSSTAAAGHIQDASENFQTAISEFERYSGKLSNYGNDLAYSTETVELALSDGRKALDTAREANPSEDQQAQIDYLAAIANAIDDTAQGYKHQLLMWENVEVVDSYQNAARRDDARDELDLAKQEQSAAAERLRSGVEQIGVAREREVSLERDLQLVEWRQRVEQTLGTVAAMAPTLDGYGHELEGWWLYEDANTLIDDREYEAAADTFWDAYEEFEEAHGFYLEAESDATGDFRQSLIKWVCQVERLRDGSEYAQAAALEYSNENWSKGDEEFQNAQEAFDRSC
jgi:hypothetical protein